MSDRPASYGSYTAYERLQRDLLGGVSGRVLELGVGKGRSARLLPRGIEYVGIEPDRRRRRRLGDRRVLGAVAERLPLPDRSMDAVVSVITLCSVESPERALAETIRVLRPGGRLLFFEHVAAPRGSWRRSAQELYRPLSRRIDHGCDPSRELWRDLEQAGFATLDLRWFKRGRVGVVAGEATCSPPNDD